MISDAYLQWLSKRAPNVRQRIERLNPNGPADGCFVRGYHPHESAFQWMCRDVLRKGQFIQKFGRDAWDRLPRAGIVKIGRREGVTSLTLLQRGLRP